MEILFRNRYLASHITSFNRVIKFSIYFRMAGRNRSMEDRIARKRDEEAINRQSWQAQTKYYDTCSRDNKKYCSWTSPECSASSMQKYQELQKSHKNSKEFEEEENQKVRLELKQKQEQEIAEREQRIKYRNRFSKHDEVQTSVLRNISNDLKAKEDAIRRVEAEKKLYQQWRLSNPYVREHEMNAREKNLKVAWLDAQIEKQMAKEKEEKEMKEYLEEREQKMKEEEAKEIEDKQSLQTRQLEYHEIIDKQIQQLKLKDELSEMLRSEEAAVLKHRQELENIAREREILTERKSRMEMDLYNLGFNRLKLRRRAKIVSEEIEQEQAFFERMLKLHEEEKQAESQAKEHNKESIRKALKCLKDQQQLELQRQEMLGVLFDSEAKAMWQKQELIWAQEKKARDNFFQDILKGLQCQIDEQVEQKVKEQQELLIEKEQMLKQIEEYNEAMRQEKEAKELKQKEYCHDLDAQVFDNRILQREKELKEEYENRRELERIKADEEKLREEIRKIQLETNVDGARFRRQKFLW